MFLPDSFSFRSLAWRILTRASWSFWLVLLFLLFEVFSFIGSYSVVEDSNELLRQSLTSQTKALMHSELAPKGAFLAEFCKHLDPVDITLTLEPFSMPLSVLSLTDKVWDVNREVLGWLRFGWLLPVLQRLYRAVFRR